MTSDTPTIPTTFTPFCVVKDALVYLVCPHPIAAVGVMKFELTLAQAAKLGSDIASAVQFVLSSVARDGACDESAAV